MTIYVRKPWEEPVGFPVNVTSGSADFGKVFSPFRLGPVRLYDGHHSVTMENGWQYSKVYAEYDDADNNGPTLDYWRWASAGWENPQAVRYPMGKGAVPLYSWWNGQKLDYIAARKNIYIPLYMQAVAAHPEAFERLKVLVQDNDVTLVDYDGYDHHQLGRSLDAVLNDPSRKMGHAFVLAMMLENWMNAQGLNR